MRAYLSAILLLCSVLCVSAQDIYKVSGKVLDKQGQAVEYAAVVMSDNSTKKLKGTTSAADGSFAMNVAPGEYILEVSLVGYEKYAVTFGVDKDIALEDIVLQEDVKMLAGAKVAANRIEYKNTGYEYKVSSIAALQKLDLSDILKTAPGLMVTENDVSLYGRDISNVYVDGRRVDMHQNDLIAYFNGFKGENIDKIDVITNPDISAVHSGTTIRITTKKQTGGIASTSARIMGNDNRFLVSPNANLTYRRGKLLLYSSANYMYMASEFREEATTDRKDNSRKESLATTDKTIIPASPLSSRSITNSRICQMTSQAYTTRFNALRIKRRTYIAQILLLSFCSYILRYSREIK